MSAKTVSTALEEGTTKRRSVVDPNVLFWIVVALIGGNHAGVKQILGSPLISLIMILFIISSAIHMKIGMQVVIEDYVQNEKLKLVTVMANNFFSIAVALAAIFAIFKMASGV